MSRDVQRFEVPVAGKHGSRDMRVVHASDHVDEVAKEVDFHCCDRIAASSRRVGEVLLASA